MGGLRQTPGPLLRQTPGPVSDSSVRQKAGSAHGVPAGAVPCVRSPFPLTTSSPESFPCVRRPIPRTASPPELLRASEGRFRARHPRRSLPVRQKAGSAHGVPIGDISVRQKPGSAHGVPAGAVPCVRRPDPRTASPPHESACIFLRFPGNRISQEVVPVVSACKSVG